jgi:hypothetical protein
VKPVLAPVEIQLPKLGYFSKYVSIKNSIEKWESKVQNNTTVDYAAMTQERHQ